MIKIQDQRDIKVRKLIDTDVNCIYTNCNDDMLLRLDSSESTSLINKCVFLDLKTLKLVVFDVDVMGDYILILFSDDVEIGYK